MQDVNNEINPNLAHLGDDMMMADGDEQGDEPMDMEVVENWVPQHPNQPQDTITFDQSGRMAKYLRAMGADIHLSMEDIMAEIQSNARSLGSDESGVVSSEHSANLIIPPFLIKACQNLLARVGWLPKDNSTSEWKEDITHAIYPV